MFIWHTLADMALLNPFWCGYLTSSWFHSLNIHTQPSALVLAVAPKYVEGKVVLLSIY